MQQGELGLGSTRLPIQSNANVQLGMFTLYFQFGYKVGGTQHLCNKGCWVCDSGQNASDAVLLQRPTVSRLSQVYLPAARSQPRGVYVVIQI